MSGGVVLTGDGWTKLRYQTDNIGDRLPCGLQRACDPGMVT
jgi:hypothetical protein